MAPKRGRKITAKNGKASPPPPSPSVREVQAEVHSNPAPRSPSQPPEKELPNMTPSQEELSDMPTSQEELSDAPSTQEELLDTPIPPEELSDIPVTKKKARMQRTTTSYSDIEKEEIIDFLKANPCLYEKRRADYKNTQLKESLWQRQAEKMGTTSNELKTWYNSQRSKLGR